MNFSSAELSGRPDQWVSGSRPFLVGVDDSRGSACVTVHASRDAMSWEEARRLRRQLREEGVFSRFRVKRYSDRYVHKGTSVESFLIPFRHDHIVYDASGFFLRAQRLVDFAKAVRSKLQQRVAGLHWQQDPSTLHIVLDRKSFPRDAKSRRSEVARVAVQVRKELRANCGSRVGESFERVKVTFTPPRGATMPVDDLSLNPHLH